MRGDCSSDARGTETAKGKILWSGVCLRGRSSAEDVGVVAVTGTPEVPKTVTVIPEAVDMEIPEAPTT